MNIKEHTLSLVRSATLNDVDAILAINREHALESKSVEQADKEGFLISAYPRELYERCLNQMLVIAVNDEVAAFSLGFRRDELPPEVADGEKIRSLSQGGDFYLIKQVGVKRKFQRQGLGRLLYRHILSGIEVPAYAPIIIQPRNLTSIEFHESLGFRCVAEYMPEDGTFMMRGIWRTF